MSQRITLSNVHGAFKRLHAAMGWPDLPAYSWPELGDRPKANIGAVMLAESGYGFNIEIISNEGGGVTTPFMGWRTKREAWDAMIAMAQAVELYKRQNETELAA